MPRYFYRVSKNLGQLNFLEIDVKDGEEVTVQDAVAILLDQIDTRLTYIEQALENRSS